MGWGRIPMLYSGWNVELKIERSPALTRSATSFEIARSGQLTIVWKHLSTITTWRGCQYDNRLTSIRCIFNGKSTQIRHRIDTKSTLNRCQFDPTPNFKYIVMHSGVRKEGVGGGMTRRGMNVSIIPWMEA